MDSRSLSTDVKRVLTEASRLNVYRKNGTACKYDIVLLFAKIWFLKAETFSTTALTPPFMGSFMMSLHKGSNFLQRTFYFPLESKVEYQFLEIIQQVPVQVELLNQSYRGVDSLGNQLRDLLYKFLVQALLFKAEVLLLSLLKSVASYILPLKGRIGTLHQGIMSVIKSQPNGKLENGKMMLANVEEVASSVISLCNCFPADKLSEEVFKNLELQLSDAQWKVELVMAELSIQTPCFNFPKIPGICFIEFLLKNLRQLLSCEHYWLSYATCPIEEICRDLELIVLEFVDASGEQFPDCQARLVNAAYQVEFVIGSMVLGNDTHWQNLSSLYHLCYEIAHIKVLVTEFFKSKACDGLGGPDVGQNLKPSVSPVTAPRTKEVMVGVEREKELVMNHLTGGSKHRKFISIVGMPGIGKSSLAKSVFNDLSLACHFQFHAWCHVSQTYSRRDVLRSILLQLGIYTLKMLLVISDEELEGLMARNLKGRRYFIVLDDIWSISVLYDLIRYMPNDQVGSRILVTSRLHDDVAQFSSSQVPLLPLSDDKSWELLKLKIHCGGEGEYPEELLEVGKEIAINCKGLPLAIGVVAGLLDEAKPNKESWRQIAESVSSRVLNDECISIFGLSYQHLSDQLKACFLYLGAFPMDEDILVQKLLRLWISEGFIPQEESKSLEDVAEKYLNDLIGRGLVLVSKRTAGGLVKACRVQTLALEFCRMKAKEENFLQLISCEDEPKHGDTSYNAYRLCICMNREQFPQPNLFSSAPYARSVLLYGQPSGACDVSFISNDLLLLRVLDLESTNVGNVMVKGVEALLDLRYIAFGGEMESIPPSISLLQNLETLVVKGLKGKVGLPDTIWSMTKLRHVHVTGHAIFTYPDDKLQRYISKLYSLTTLSLVNFSLVEEANKAIFMLPNLRKLKCQISEPQFPEFGNLSQLEVLKLSYSGSRQLDTAHWNLPSSLRQLTLSNLRLPWDQISVVGELPNLEVLKLINRAFAGVTWKMAKGEFARLKYLKLDTLFIVQWDVSDENLWCLEQLVLRKCKRLEEVPFDLTDVSNLSRIEVHQCGDLVQESFKRIVEECWNQDLISSFS